MAVVNSALPLRHEKYKPNDSAAQVQKSSSSGLCLQSSEAQRALKEVPPSLSLASNLSKNLLETQVDGDIDVHCDPDVVNTFRVALQDNNAHPILLVHQLGETSKRLRAILLEHSVFFLIFC
jgi:hypothetical protein